MKRTRRSPLTSPCYNSLVPSVTELHLLDKVYGDKWFFNYQLVGTKILQYEFSSVGVIESVVFQVSGQQTLKSIAFDMTVDTKDKKGNVKRFYISVLSLRSKTCYTIDSDKN